MTDQQHTTPFSVNNIRLFIAFRVFFNARFYYPVFTIIFLDFGLTIEQFAILNSVWALTIVLTEVPSGALADILGRKKLLLTTSMLMMIELGLLCFVPLENMTLVFWVFLINRILSGLAEAMASGADEAIAYDSLVKLGKQKEWPKVLSVQMRISSLASIITGTTGALMYDPNLMTKLLSFFGSTTILVQQQTMRLPLYFTFILSVLATTTVWLMEEVKVNGEAETSGKNEKYSIIKATRKTFEAGGWILHTPFALAVILFGMTFDHVVRMMVTMTSQYYRLIAVPEALFGIIGAGISFLGLMVPKIAEKMAESFSPFSNMLIISAITFTGFLGIAFFVPWLGIIPVGLIFMAIMLTSFFSSHYLNHITPSHQRATVLSFKGLAFNLAYGGIGVLFAALMQQIKTEMTLAEPPLTQPAIDNSAFEQAVGWFPSYTLISIVLIAVLCKYILRNTDLTAVMNQKSQE